MEELSIFYGTEVLRLCLLRNVVVVHRFNKAFDKCYRMSFERIFAWLRGHAAGYENGLRERLRGWDDLHAESPMSIEMQMSRKLDRVLDIQHRLAT